MSRTPAGCLRDPQSAGKVTHEKTELMRQRIFAIALGYPDGNDARALSHDPPRRN
ncbi:MAG: transposase [Deltaproteobacteria bacterium]|nr:transposase [Deltaproteobacteria bacterium]